MKDKNMINDISSNLSINIIKGFYMHHKANWFESKAKSDYTLWIVTDGEIHLKTDGKEYILAPGDAVLFYPEDQYSAWCDTECKFLYVYFKLNMGHEIDLLSNMNLSGIASGEHIGDLSKGFCKKFISLYKTSQHASLELYSVFLSYISKVIYFAQTSKYIRFYSEKQNKDSHIHSIINHINDHIYDDIKIKQLALKFHLSEKHLIRKFKAATGMSPGQYILQARMRKSVELITDTNIKIYEIAKIMRYSDQYAFSKAFKKYYGEAPSNFRKMVSE